MQRATAIHHRDHTAVGFVADRLSLLLGALAMLSMGAALYAALIYAPTERIQGNVQRIFYFHVPLAWAAYLAFLVVLVASCA